MLDIDLIPDVGFYRFVIGKQQEIESKSKDHVYTIPAFAFTDEKVRFFTVYKMHASPMPCERVPPLLFRKANQSMVTETLSPGS